MKPVDLSKIKWGDAWECPQCHTTMVIPARMDKDDPATKVVSVSHGCGGWSPVDSDYYIEYLKLHVKEEGES
jgi:hypothetical protein